MDKKNQFPQSAEVDAFRQHILKTAEEMVVTKFPKRIVQLNKMLTSGKLTSDPSSVYQKINIPVPDCTELGSTTTSASALQQQTAGNVAANKQSGASATTGTTAAQSGSASSNGETGVSDNLC